jgi:prepilin-type processing-associated H-X9-DG protein
LIELLIVIAIIVVLISILLPVVTSIHQSSRRLVCATNIRSVLAACRFYAQQNDDWLPPGSFGSANLIGAAPDLNATLGGADTVQRLLTCPDDYFCQANHPYVTSSWGPYLYYTTSYLYVGGAGYYDKSGNTSVNIIGTQYFGWINYGVPVYQTEYFDTNGFGPVLKLTSKRRTSEVGLMTDRMWPKVLIGPDGNQDTDMNGLIYLNDIGPVPANHRNTNGETSGGNVGYLDGHVAWITLPDASVVNNLNAPDSSVRQRVMTYYGGLVIY